MTAAPAPPPELPGCLARGALALAERFSAGATMWCVSPQWPEHARHLAVEFVHPVIVGKRALPAVHLAGPDPAPSLRLLARPGDVLAVIVSGSLESDAGTEDLLRRAGTWGLLRMWLSGGAPPPVGLVDHAWITDPGPADLILAYHVLWELTHVVFEHPGLLGAGATKDPAVCVTCVDQAELAEIQSVGADHMAEALIEGRLQPVDVSLLDGARPRDLVLVHAGVAIGPGSGERPGRADQ